MWVKDAPKKDGWYWAHARGQLSGNKYVHPVHVYRNGETVFSDGENFTSNSDMFVAWWDEEIKEPSSQELMARVDTCVGFVKFSQGGHDYTKDLKDLKITYLRDDCVRVVFEFDTKPSSKESYGYQVLLILNGNWTGGFDRLSPGHSPVQGVIKQIVFAVSDGRVAIGGLWVEDSEEWTMSVDAIIKETVDVREEELRVR